MFPSFDGLFSASEARSPTLPMGQLLVQAAGRFRDSAHLLAPSAENDGQYDKQTFVQTLAGAEAVAVRLLQAGVRTGDSVAFFGDCTPGRFAVAFGIWLAGGVVVPLDPEWSGEALARALTKVGAKLGIADRRRTGLLQETSRDMDEFLCLEEEELASKCQREELPDVDPQSRALIMFTSGTTGDPKAAVMRHSGLFWNTQALSESIGVTAEDNLLGGLPLHHMVGMVAMLLLPAHSGARVALPRSLTGLDIKQCMCSTGVTLVATVPQLLEGFDKAIQSRVQNLGWPRRGLFSLMTRLVRVCRFLGWNPGPYLFRSIHEAFGGRLRRLGSGSAPLDPAVGRRLWSVGFSVVEGYGLTETGPAICFDNPKRPQFGSVGFPLDGVDVRILEPDNQGIGEVLVRSPACFEGYLDDPEATNQILRDGWVFTGDLGRLDRKGRLYLTGRKKEVVVLGSGLKVYPQEVETRLNEMRWIAESCVLGLSEDGRPGGEKLHAVVVPDFRAMKGSGILRIEATLRSEVYRIGDGLPSHHRIMGITVRSDPLPRTQTGKIKRFQVEEDLAAYRAGSERPFTQATGPLPASHNWKQVERALGRVSTYRGTIVPSSYLELDLGLDSLARIEALSHLEQTLKMKLPEGFGAECLTAGDLLEAVDALGLDGSAADGFGFQGMSRQAEGVVLKTLPRRLLRPIGLVLLLILKFPTWLFCRLFWGFQVTGIENIPSKPVLICPKHTSPADPIILLVALPFRLAARGWWLGHERIFGKPLMRLLGTMGNVITNDPNTGLRTTLALGTAVLASGAPLFLFPEGVVPHGEQVPYRRGAATLARTADVPIVPVAIVGAGRLLPRGTLKLGFGFRVSVRIGKPIDHKEVRGGGDPAAALTQYLRRRIEMLAE